MSSAGTSEHNSPTGYAGGNFFAKGKLSSHDTL